MIVLVIVHDALLVMVEDTYVIRRRELCFCSDIAIVQDIDDILYLEIGFYMMIVPAFLFSQLYLLFKRWMTLE